MSAELAARYGLESPRTAYEPMAFRFVEFVRGAFIASGWFLLLSLVCFAVIPPLLGSDPRSWVFTPFMMAYVGFPMIVIPASIAGILVGSPFAYLLGRSLRRVTKMGAHVAAFAVLGLLVGSAVSALTLMLMPMGPLMISPFVVAASVAVPLGWHRTARRALADDDAAAASVDAVPALPED